MEYRNQITWWIFFLITGFIFGWYFSTDEMIWQSFAVPLNESQKGGFFYLYQSFIAGALAFIGAYLAYRISKNKNKYDEKIRNDKIASLKHLCELQLDEYDQLMPVEYLTKTLTHLCVIQNKREWIRFKSKFPHFPDIFNNHKLLMELDPKFIENTYKLKSNHHNFTLLIRKVDDIHELTNGPTDDQNKNLIREFIMLGEQYAATINLVRTKRKYCIPENSIYSFIYEHQ